MNKNLVIIGFFLSILPSKAVFTDFANPTKKEIKLNKTKIRLKPYKHKIADAVIWHLPDRNFLGKNFRTEEEQLIDSEALERFIAAAFQKNPDAYKIYNSKNKNSKLINEVIGLASQQVNIDILNNYIQSKNFEQEQQKNIVINEIKNIKKLYQELKALYRQGSRVTPLYYQDLKTKISACCGLENFLFVENLLKREINYEIFNS